MLTMKAYERAAQMIKDDIKRYDSYADALSNGGWVIHIGPNGGTLEHAQQIANHSSPRTTKLYDRRQDEISLDEVEKIAI